MRSRTRTHQFIEAVSEGLPPVPRQPAALWLGVRLAGGTAAAWRGLSVLTMVVDHTVPASLAGRTRVGGSMFVNVGRFRFRPMGQDEQQSLVQRMKQDIPPMARESPGFCGVYFVRLSDDELMTVWLWDTEADWEAALARFGPLLQQYVVPNLAQPPERVGGEVVVQVTP